jgi:hypothetical protein
MTELLVGTKKGMFRLEGDPAGGFEITARAFPGQSVEYAMRDPRTGRYLASVTSWFYGPRIWVTDDPTGEWEQAKGTVLPGRRRGRPRGEFSGDPADEYKGALKRLWVIVPGEEDGVLYAAATPARSSRAGRRAHLVAEPLACGITRRGPSGTPGAGGLCLHTIVTWPGDPSKLSLAISAVGVWLTDDGGASWRHSNEGIVLRYLPEEARAGTAEKPQHCVHNVRRAPERPERLFMQFHDGIYRSDDAGRRGSMSAPTRACRPISGSRSPSTPPTPTAPT